LVSAKAINNNLNKTDKPVHHLNYSKLGNVTVPTSTAAASNRYYDELITLTQTPRILTKFSNWKPSKFRNCWKSAINLSKKWKNMFSQTGPREVWSNLCKRPNLSWKRAKRKLWGLNVLLYCIWDQISKI